MENTFGKLLVNNTDVIINREIKGFIDTNDSFCRINSMVILNHIANTFNVLPVEDIKHFITEQYNSLRYV